MAPRSVHHCDHHREAGLPGSLPGHVAGALVAADLHYPSVPIVTVRAAGYQRIDDGATFSICVDGDDVTSTLLSSAR